MCEGNKFHAFGWHGFVVVESIERRNARERKHQCVENMWAENRLELKARNRASIEYIGSMMMK